MQSPPSPANEGRKTENIHEKWIDINTFPLFNARKYRCALLPETY
jgi:hypothetical protein